MISSKDFDYFLKNGYVPSLEPFASMHSLFAVYGCDIWYVKNFEDNGLAYGVAKVGITEFHIYNEKIFGYSYRPDLGFAPEDYAKEIVPWIVKSKDINTIESNLAARQIIYDRETIIGPVAGNSVRAGLTLYNIEEGEHTYIDTEGGVTFLFEENRITGKLEAYQVCKYYDLSPSNNIA